MAEESVQRRLAAIVSADVVGYSRMMGRDEAGTLARLKALRSEFLHPKVAEYGGRIVKTTGDGTLIEFPSAVNAVQHAVEVQRGLADRNAELPENQRIRLRLGINLGDIIIDGDDIYGDGVNIAARLEALAKAGEVYVSASVFDQVADKLDFAFDDLGDQALKNIARPVRTYRVSSGSRPMASPAAGPGTAAAADKPTVAVLPFSNMSGDPEQEYFSDGITEDIITDLSKVSGLSVIARNSSFVYKGKPVSVKDVGRELGVQFVLEGSVRRAGNRLRITGQLIDCRTDRHVWAERFDRNLDDIFAVQEDVARQVVEALEVTLRPAEDRRLTRASICNPEAYDEFLRGRLTVHPPTKENVAEAKKRFQRVIEIDPGFAGGYAGLALVRCLEIFFHQGPRTAETLQEALDLANKAVAGDELLGWPYTVLAWANAVNGRHDEMVAAAAKAVEIQPGDAESHAYYGLFLTMGGRPLEAIPYIETAIRLSPRFFVPYLNFFAYANATSGNHDAAIAAITDNPPGSYSAATFAYLILAYFEKGDLKKAKETARYALERFPVEGAFDWITFALKRSGDRERFIRALEETGIQLAAGRSQDVNE